MDLSDDDAEARAAIDRLVIEAGVSEEDMAWADSVLGLDDPDPDEEGNVVEPGSRPEGVAVEGGA